MTTDKKLIITNRSSIRTKFAVRFLLAMKKLNKKKPPNLNKLKRYHMIKSAAYASMASAVGPRRAWSRAVLWKIKNRRSLMIKNRSKRVFRQTPKNDVSTDQQEYDLRRLVPGGKGMDLGRLLSETAHYIKCLRAQVEVMNNIADYYSN